MRQHLAEPGARWASFSKNGIPSSSATVRRLISHQWWLGTREPGAVGEDLSRSPLSGRVIGVSPCGGGAGGSTGLAAARAGWTFERRLVEAEVAAWSAPSGHMLGFPLPVRLRKSRQVAQPSGPLVSAATSDRAPAGEFGGSRLVMRPPPGRWMLVMGLAVCSIGSGPFDSTETGRWRVRALWSADDHDASGHLDWRVLRRSEASSGRSRTVTMRARWHRQGSDLSGRAGKRLCVTVDADRVLVSGRLGRVSWGVLE